MNHDVLVRGGGASFNYAINMGYLTAFNLPIVKAMQFL